MKYRVIILAVCAFAMSYAGCAATEKNNDGKTVAGSGSEAHYSYIEWIELSGKDASSDLQQLVLNHLGEPYENARNFATEQNAPVYLPSIAYALYDVNGDGESDVIGQVYSGYLCGRHSGCPTVILIKQEDGSYTESFNEEVLGRLGVTDTGMLANEVRDFDFYKCQLYRLDRRGYFNLLEDECDER